MQKRKQKIIKQLKILYFTSEQSFYINCLRVKCFLAGKQLVHFLHIGKTGGTAFIEAIQDIGLLKKAPRKIKFAETDDYIICIHNHSFALKNVPIGEKSFFFVRDPIKRFISGFYGRKREDKPRYNIPWSSQEKEAFLNFDTPNDLALALESNDEKTRRSALKAMRSIQHVSTFLSGWTGDSKYLKAREDDILFIGFQDNLDVDVLHLGKILDFPAHFQLPKDDVKTHKNPSSFSTDLSTDAYNNLKKWYSKDFKILETCKEIANTKKECYK